MVKNFLRVLQGDAAIPPPLWLMRQAGRYLPEYRALRAEAGSFLDLCFNPAFAAEVTLQPMRRYDFDAAIIFADILLLPYALGRKLDFVAGEGPKLDPLRSLAELAGKTPGDRLDPVYEALTRVRAALPADKTLLGFCGAPWTVACYMIEGGGSKDFAATKAFARENRADFLRLLDILAEASADYLARQLQAGADAVQIFDSWAGLVAPEDFEDFVLAPTRKIVTLLRANIPGAPVIGFPRGAGILYDGYAAATGVNALGLDQSVTLDHAAALQKHIPVQGNLAPDLLVAGGDALRGGVARIMEKLAGRPFIFNLGHGVTPDTPPAHVAELVRLVRGA